MKKLTDEELSRVLTAHAVEELEYLDPDDAERARHHNEQARGGCLMQTAHATVSDRFDGHLHAEWFDANAGRILLSDSDEFLALLEEADIA